MWSSTFLPLELSLLYWLQITLPSIKKEWWALEKDRHHRNNVTPSISRKVYSFYIYFFTPITLGATVLLLIQKLNTTQFSKTSICSLPYCVKIKLSHGVVHIYVDFSISFAAFMSLTIITSKHSNAVYLSNISYSYHVFIDLYIQLYLYCN